MISLNIDTKKMPLGKLSQSQIDKGYTILNKIKLALKGNSSQAVKDEIMDLSSEYYTLIPYVCNRSSTPPIINTDKMVQTYTETLDELSNLTVAATVVKDSTFILLPSLRSVFEFSFANPSSFILQVQHQKEMFTLLTVFTTNLIQL